MSDVWYKISARVPDGSTAAPRPLIGYVINPGLLDEIAAALQAHLGVEAVIEEVPAPPVGGAVVAQVLASLSQERGRRHVTSSIVRLLPQKDAVAGANVQSTLIGNRPTSILLEVWRVAEPWTGWPGVQSAPQPSDEDVRANLIDLSQRIATIADPRSGVSIPSRMTRTVANGPHVECVYVIPWGGVFIQEVSAVVPMENVAEWTSMVLNLGGTLVSQVPIRDGELIWIRPESPRDWRKLGAYYGKRAQ